MSEPIRFKMMTATPEEWAKWVVALPFSPDKLAEALKIMFEDAYQTGYKNGMQHTPGDPMPWDARS